MGTRELLAQPQRRRISKSATPKPRCVSAFDFVCLFTTWGVVASQCEDKNGMWGGDPCRSSACAACVCACGIPLYVNACLAHPAVSVVQACERRPTHKQHSHACTCTTRMRAYSHASPSAYCACDVRICVQVCLICVQFS